MKGFQIISKSFQGHFKVNFLHEDLARGHFKVKNGTSDERGHRQRLMCHRKYQNLLLLGYANTFLRDLTMAGNISGFFMECFSGRPSSFDTSRISHIDEQVKI